MNAQELRNLQEAYLEVVENQQLDEISMRLSRQALKSAERRTDSSWNNDFESTMNSGAEKFSPDDYSDTTRKNLDKENKIRSYIEKKKKNS